MNERTKEIVYRYDQNSSNDERVVDSKGEIPTFKRGDVIERRGKRWKIQFVEIQPLVTDPKGLPIHWIYLAPDENSVS